MLIPKTNSSTFQPRAVSHVVNGTIFSICSTLRVISCLLAAIWAIRLTILEMLQKRDLREIWSPPLPICLQQCQFVFCNKFSSVTHRFCPELEHVDTCCEIEKEHHQSNFDSSNLTISPHIVGYLHKVCAKRATETWSSKRRQNWSTLWSGNIGG